MASSIYDDDFNNFTNDSFWSINSLNQSLTGISNFSRYFSVENASLHNPVLPENMFEDQKFQNVENPDGIFNLDVHGPHIEKTDRQTDRKTDTNSHVHGQPARKTALSSLDHDHLCTTATTTVDNTPRNSGDSALKSMKSAHLSRENIYMDYHLNDGHCSSKHGQTHTQSCKSPAKSPVTHRYSAPNLKHSEASGPPGSKISANSLQSPRKFQNSTGKRGNWRNRTVSEMGNYYLERPQAGPLDRPRLTQKFSMSLKRTANSMKRFNRESTENSPIFEEEGQISPPANKTPSPANLHKPSIVRPPKPSIAAVRPTGKQGSVAFLVNTETCPRGSCPRKSIMRPHLSSVSSNHSNTSVENFGQKKANFHDLSEACCQKCGLWNTMAPHPSFWYIAFGMSLFWALFLCGGVPGFIGIVIFCCCFERPLRCITCKRTKDRKFRLAALILFAISVVECGLLAYLVYHFLGNDPATE